MRDLGQCMRSFVIPGISNDQILNGVNRKIGSKTVPGHPEYLNDFPARNGAALGTTTRLVDHPVVLVRVRRNLLD